MRVLITGITGFVGSHLTEYVLANHPEVEIFGTKRWRSPKDNIRQVLDRITLQDCDLRDLSSIIALFDQVRPGCRLSLGGSVVRANELHCPGGYAGLQRDRYNEPAGGSSHHSQRSGDTHLQFFRGLRSSASGRGADPGRLSVAAGESVCREQSRRRHDRFHVLGGLRT